MNLREEILKEHSKVQCNKIVKWIANSQERFNELFQLFLHDEYRVVQRAASPVSYCVIANPKFIADNFEELIVNLKKPGIHNSIKRNSIRLLQHVEIPERYQGEIMNLCFEYIASPTEPVAAKVFSMTVLANLSNKYPDIKKELKQLIEEQLPHQTSAFKSRASKLLKK
jgi:hypothetical protein